MISVADFARELGIERKSARRALMRACREHPDLLVHYEGQWCVTDLALARRVLRDAPRPPRELRRR